MSWYYFLNRMGPLSRDGMYDGYAGGRIDCDCADENDPDYYKYGHEIAVPLVKEEDWYTLSEWVDKLVTDKLDLDLLARYEKETGNKLRWFREKE